MKVVKHEKAFHIDELPLQNINIIDNWLHPLTHAWVNEMIRSFSWQLTNQVQKPNGEYAHRFWGTALYIKDRNCPDTFYPLSNIIREEEYTSGRHVFTRFMHNLIQDSFGFDWGSLDYIGTNGQTVGLQGTIHLDSQSDQNISFLYYDQPMWNKDWGGQLHFYNGKKELVESIDYVPNRLVFFDGRTFHSADAPVNCNYEIRTSLVVRGEQAILRK